MGVFNVGVRNMLIRYTVQVPMPCSQLPQFQYLSEEASTEHRNSMTTAMEWVRIWGYPDHRIMVIGSPKHGLSQIWYEILHLV